MGYIALLEKHELRGEQGHEGFVGELQLLVLGLGHHELTEPLSRHSCKRSRNDLYEENRDMVMLISTGSHVVT